MQRTRRNLSEANFTNAIHMFFLLDNSGSMAGKNLQALNEAMENLIRSLAAESRKQGVLILMHILSFSGAVRWLCGTTCDRGVSVHDIRWRDLTDEYNTDTAAAIEAIRPGLNRDKLGYRTYKPIVVLISDGHSDDRQKTRKAIEELVDTQLMFRIAIGVDGYNAEELQDFVSTGIVKTVDTWQNEISRSEQGLIFPVQNATQLAPIITNVSICTLLSSIHAGMRTHHSDGEDRIEIEMPAANARSAQPLDLDSSGWLK